MHPHISFKKLLLLLCLLTGFAALFLLSASAESHEAVFYVDGAAVLTQNTDETGAMALPDVPEIGEKQFLGWVYTRAGQEKLYAAKSAFKDPDASGKLTFHALTLDLQTLTGAAASMSEPYSLRFDASVPETDFDRLVSLVGRENVTVGLLTAPYRMIIGKGTNFNHTDGATFVTDFPAAAPAYESGGMLCFCARVSGISASGMLDKYAARGYLTVRYETGAVRTVYAPFRNADHARAVHGVLAAAYEDFSRTADEKYTASFTAGDETLWSPYNAPERAWFAAGLDRVINVQTPTQENEATRIVSAYSLDEIHFKEFFFYTSPYEVTSAVINDQILTVVVAGKNGADFHNIATYYIGNSYSIYLLDKCRMESYGFVITQNIETAVH